jgi:hypothetical protein
MVPNHQVWRRTSGAPDSERRDHDEGEPDGGDDIGEEGEAVALDSVGGFPRFRSRRRGFATALARIVQVPFTVFVQMDGLSVAVAAGGLFVDFRFEDQRRNRECLDDAVDQRGQKSGEQTGLDHSPQHGSSA